MVYSRHPPKTYGKCMGSGLTYQKSGQEDEKAKAREQNPY